MTLLVARGDHPWVLAGPELWGSRSWNTGAVSPLGTSRIWTLFHDTAVHSGAGNGPSMA